MINTLYRKYRPKALKEVVGQKHITSTLAYSIKNNKTHHAYIFSGIRGTGKTTLAKIIARSVNCLNFQDDLCLKCSNCINSENGNIDILELDAASNNGVSEIRNIIENISYMPQSLSQKVYIIDEAHMLTTNAWNALLKTIEEPPRHIYFIFATTEFHKIPLTILSRCQHFKLSRLTEPCINEIIENVCKSENIKIDDESKKKIFKLSNGSARDSLTILEQLSIYSRNDITINIVNSLFGFIENKTIISFIENLFLNNILDVWNQLDDFKNKIDANQFIDQLIGVLIDIKLYNETKSTLILDFLFENDINYINDNFENNKIIKLLEMLYELNKNSFSSDHKFFNLKILISVFNTSNIKNNVISKNTENINVVQNVNIKDFDKEKLFSTWEEKIENTKEHFDEINKMNEESSSKILIKDIFAKIAHFNDSKKTTKLNEILRNIRQEQHYDEILKILSLSNRFFINSNNFSILLFEFDNDAKKFNKLFYKPENKEIIFKYFYNDMLILALCFKEAKEFNDYAKTIKKEHIKELTYDEIKKYLNQLKEEMIKESILKLI